MIYLDTCYILKCYLTERGSHEVRALTENANGLASCMLARVEFFAAVHRHFREGKLDGSEVKDVFEGFREDEASGYWLWHGLGGSLLEEATAMYETLPATTFLRSADALHLVCARHQGYREIYTSDRHVLAAAPFFGLRSVNVIT